MEALCRNKIKLNLTNCSVSWYTYEWHPRCKRIIHRIRSFLWIKLSSSSQNSGSRAHKLNWWISKLEWFLICLLISAVTWKLIDVSHLEEHLNDLLAPW